MRFYDGIRFMIYELYFGANKQQPLPQFAYLNIFQFLSNDIFEKGVFYVNIDWNKNRCPTCPITRDYIIWSNKTEI